MEFKKYLNLLRISDQSKNITRLFSLFKERKIGNFRGGINPPEMKSRSNKTPIHRIEIPYSFIIPFKRQISGNGRLCIKKGDSVLRGQPLTLNYDHIPPIHSPTSGKIVAIASHPVAHSSKLLEPCVIIHADGNDRWIERDGWKNYCNYTRKSLINRIHQFGIVGLGGAGFPTGIKLNNSEDKIKTLIINAVECEPYITADDCLIQNCASQIIEGIRIIAYILQVKEIIIGIESNKLRAIHILSTLLSNSCDIKLKIIPTKYPSGSARLLTQILIGKKIKNSKHLLDIGVLVQNISTVYAVKRAIIDGEPLTERILTVTGESIPKPGNVWARLGTSVLYILEQLGFSQNNKQLVIMGGPMMGLALHLLDVPIIKTTNCLLAPSIGELDRPHKERNCIRCNFCAKVCPVNLLPQQLYWFSKSNQHRKAQIYNITDCIECGACAWVCPSNIPLVQYFKQEKAEIYSIFLKERRAIEAKARFKARQIRLGYKH